MHGCVWEIGVNETGGSAVDVLGKDGLLAA